MAEALYLVTRSQSVGLRTVNGVQAVLINKDSGQTNPQIIASAVEQCNDCFAGTNTTSPFDAAYFDTVTLITVASGAMNDDEDAFIFANDTAPIKVEG